MPGWSGPDTRTRTVSSGSSGGAVHARYGTAPAGAHPRGDRARRGSRSTWRWSRSNAVDDAVRIVRLNRPERLNALSIDLAVELDERARPRWARTTWPGS